MCLEIGNSLSLAFECGLFYIRVRLFSERPVKLFSIQERSPALPRDLLSAHTTADKLGKGQH
jgi:hypothetical protein